MQVVGQFYIYTLLHGKMKIRKKKNIWILLHLVGFLLTLYALFWVILRRLNFICQRFGTFCLFHLHRRVPTCQWRWNRQSDSKRWHIKFRRPGNYPEESIEHSEHGESYKQFLILATFLLKKKKVTEGEVA